MQQLQKDLNINLTKCKKRHFCNKTSFVIFFWYYINNKRYIYFIFKKVTKTNFYMNNRILN